MSDRDAHRTKKKRKGAPMSASTTDITPGQDEDVIMVTVTEAAAGEAVLTEATEAAVVTEAAAGEAVVTEATEAAAGEAVVTEATEAAAGEAVVTEAVAGEAAGEADETTRVEILYEVRVARDQGIYASRALPRLIAHLNERYQLKAGRKLNHRVLYRQLRQQENVDYKCIFIRKRPLVNEDAWKEELREEGLAVHPRRCSFVL
jgi:hypothetical protein